MKSSTIIGGTGDYERSAMDFYETPREATVALIEHIKTYITSLSCEQITILEPCCGEGAIAEVLKEYGFGVVANDIRDTKYAGSGVDYLSRPFMADVIITNPPFNLAQEFIEKALMEAHVVAMLLKANFWHTKKRLDLFKKTSPSMVLPLTWRPPMAPDRGKSPTMDFQWTVWGIENNECEYFPLKKPNSDQNVQASVATEDQSSNSVD